MMGVNGSKPPPPTGGNHSRKPPPPPPRQGRPVCRAGRIIGAIILGYMLAALIGIVTA